MTRRHRPIKEGGWRPAGSLACQLEPLSRNFDAFWWVGSRIKGAFVGGKGLHRCTRIDVLQEGKETRDGIGG